MDYVRQGDALKASWANDVVSFTKQVEKTDAFKHAGRKMIYNAFDPIMCDFDGSSWTIKIQPSWIIEGNTTQKISVKDKDNADKDLDEYPEISVPDDKNLYLDQKARKLTWETAPQSDKLLILEVTQDGDSIEITNKYPAVVTKSILPPFYCSVDQDGKALVNTGYVIERIIGTDSSLKYWLPTGMEASGVPTPLTISVGQQVSVKVLIDVYGAISAAPSVVVETEDPESSHYVPICGDDREGTTGEYHYKLAVLQETDGVKWFKQYNGGSNISHFVELPFIDNCLEEATDDCGRTVLEYNLTDNKYKFRTIKKKDESELKVTEDWDNIFIGGNEVEGSIGFQFKDYFGSAIEWKDGLVTSGGGLTWEIPETLDEEGNLTVTIGDGEPTNVLHWDKWGMMTEGGNVNVDIPSIVAGDGIDISTTDNVSTISATGGLPEGFSEMELTVCIDGTPTTKIFLVKDV